MTALAERGLSCQHKFRSLSVFEICYFETALNHNEKLYLKEAQFDWMGFIRFSFLPLMQETVHANCAAVCASTGQALVWLFVHTMAGPNAMATGVHKHAQY